MPRTLASVLRPYTTARSRSRGDAYARQDRVTIIHSDEASVSARVRGSSSYEVALTIANGFLRPTCSCPFFDGMFEPCKHIWALALEVDRQRLLTLPQELDLDLDAGDGDDWDDLDLPMPPPRATPATTRRGVPAWQQWLAAIPATVAPLTTATPTGELIYVFDPVRSSGTQGLLIELLRRQRRRDGSWGKPRDASITREALAALPDEADREILERVCGAEDTWTGNWNFGRTLPVPSPFVLPPVLQRDLVPRLCATQRFLLRQLGPDSQSDDLQPMVWRDEIAHFRLTITGSAQTGYVVSGQLDHDGRERPLTDALFVTRSLILWRPDGDRPPTFTRFDAAGAERWLAGLIAVGTMEVPASGAQPLLDAIATSGATRVTAPDDLAVETRHTTPTPILRVTQPSPRAAWTSPRLALAVHFGYGPLDIEAGDGKAMVFDREARVVWPRDRVHEAAALSRLTELGARPMASTDPWASAGPVGRFDLAETQLAPLVARLLTDGWRVEANGRAFRRPGPSTLGVRSGIDWFELRGEVDYDGMAASLPSVLAAARRGETYVTLDDGSLGLLPDEWLARSVRMASVGEVHDDHVRFQPSQAALIDAWLADQPAVTWDEPFARLRDTLTSFAGVPPLPPPPTFAGALRDYQQDALGWFAFLRQFGFGGCLADEMGLGKTVMVLAALEARRLERQQAGSPRVPSLIVVPRSLVFNWSQEAARFAPALRVLDASGAKRRDLFAQIAEHDVVVVTYGTLRRDIGLLKDLEFDYAILDEAQAIKNASTAAARAARLLRARHRLALSGTPVENHLGELWSLFEFLNPGLLGGATAFTGARTLSSTDDQEMLTILSRGLRPFILRRTKEQVATELPARTEQTLYCDLEPAQRRIYDGLRAHYRSNLLGKVERDGMGKSTLHVLEALLRLRQAACHPGLVDDAHQEGPSAKLDVLLPRLQELVEDGRKVIVFSQFTSMLALLRERLDASALSYEYLDGRTRNREARVRQFQDGPTQIFLISLKAGGLGLNLTAAEYVFLLDPWWNPAVEAQAIDRAHRIGQTRAVFAWRLIARDTVEEKVLELQAGKRQLADAVVRADASLLRDLKREDLELLLS